MIGKLSMTIILSTGASAPSKKEIFERAFSFLVGEKLGEGTARQVFEIRASNYQILKIQFSDIFPWQNHNECELYHIIKNTSLEKWFAPVFSVSDCRRLMVMGRTRPAIASEYPARIPAIFKDLKPENFGILLSNGKFVCHDYGINSAIHLGINNRKMQKVVWSLVGGLQG